MQTQSATSEMECTTFNLVTRVFSVIEGGVRMPVADAWFETDAAWIRLADPVSSKVENFKVVTAFPVDKNKYVVLQTAVEVSSGEWQVNNIIMRLVNPDTLSTIDFEEYTRVSKDAVRRVGTEQLHLLLQSFFGYDIPNLSNNMEAKMLRGNLTQLLHLGLSAVGEGRELHIKSVWKYGLDDVYVRLALPGDAEVAEFLVPYVATIRNRDYALLMYEPNTSADRTSTLIVTAIKGPEWLSTVGLNEVLAVSRRLIRVVQSGRRSNMAEFGKHFGEIHEGD